MQLTVKGIRGADSVELQMPWEKITLVAGENAQGKSSIVEACQAVLGLRPFPPKAPKSYGKLLVNDAHSEGFCKIETTQGIRKISYPSGEIHTLQGTGLVANHWSLGLIRLMDLSVEDRARKLIEITRSQVTKERLEKELESLNIEKEKLNELIAKALNNSFDVASKHASETASGLKGSFKMVAGVQWGSNQGVTFTPEGWTEELGKTDLDTLKSEVSTLRIRLEEAIGIAAVAKSAAEHAGKKEERVAEVEKWNKAVEQLAADLDKAQEKAALLQKTSHSVTCSGCGLVGIIENDSLVASTPSDPSAFHSSNDLVKLLNKKLADARGELSLAKTKLGLAAAAATHPQEVPDVEALRMTVASAEKALAAKTAKDKGTHLHYQITDWLKAAEILSPEGLPRKALNDALELFNKRLSKLCELAGWSTVEVNRDLDLLFNQRSYRLLSKSERYRADASIQLLVSKIEKQEIVVFDEADMLDRVGRNQLFTALSKCKISSLVAMTCFKNREGVMEVPDLAKAGLGLTYIVDGGVSKPLHQEAAA